MDFQDEFGFGASFGAPQAHPPAPAHNGQAEQFSGKLQAQMWQEQHYMGGGGRTNNPESGFISASTSHPSSRNGHEDAIEDGCYTGPGSIVSGSLYDMDSAAHSEVTSLASNHPGLNDPVEHIPQLVTALRDDDLVVVQESLLFVDKCVRKDHFNKAFFNALIRSTDLVMAIVNALVNAFQGMIDSNKNGQNEALLAEAKKAFDSAEKRTRIASNILRAMTNQHDNPLSMQIACRNILVSGGVAALTSLLGVDLPHILFNGAVAIHNLLNQLKDKEERQDAKMQVRQAKGINLMTALLERKNPKLLAVLCDCLYILSSGDRATKQLILKVNGTARVLNILKSETYKSLIEKAVHLLQALSVCQENKRFIVKSGGLEILSKFLHESDKTPCYASLAMRNLSDISDGIANFDKLAQALVRALRHPDPQVAVCSACIISNLTVDKSMKLGVLRASGLQELTRIVDTPNSSKDFVEPALCAIRHLTNNHVNLEEAQKMFVMELQGLQKLERWLIPSASPRSCLKAALGIVRNLSQNLTYHAILRERQFVHQILKIFLFTFDEVEAKGSQGNTPVDGVRLLDILELSVNCIYGMSKSGENRAIIRDPAIVSTLKVVLVKPSVNLQRLTCAILCEVSQEPEGAFAVHHTGSCHNIETLIGRYQDANINSPEQKTAAFASSTMNAVERIRQALQSGEYRAPPIQQQFQLGPHVQLAPPPHIPNSHIAYSNGMYAQPGGHHQRNFPNNQPYPQGNYPPVNMGYDDMMPEMQQQPIPGPSPGFDAHTPMGMGGLPDDMDMFGPDGTFY